MISQQIRHLVLVKFRADVGEQAINDLWRALHNLPTVIDGMGNVFAGRSVSPEQIERGYMHAFSVDFESMAALQAYLPHPGHKKFSTHLLSLTEGGLDGILVFDLPL